MSGHSKWHNIQKTKGAADAKKAKVFTKYAREMAIAIREGGGADPNSNSKLAAVISRAKSDNVPNDNIKRTLQKYQSGAAAENYEYNTYEGYGPGGVAVIAECLTDNRNRTVADVRHYFDKYGAGLGASGCVSWSFDKKGVLVIDNSEEELDEEEVMMDAMDAGADDFEADGDVFTIYTLPDDFNDVVANLGKYTFVSAQIEMVPQNYQKLESEEHIALMEKLIDIMEDDDDVQNLWHNWDQE